MKMMSLLSVIASALVLVGCACMGQNTAGNTNAAKTAGVTSHHDYKGEMSTK